MEDTQVVTATDQANEAGGTVVEAVAQTQQTVAVGKTKNAKTGNLILDIAHEVEGLSKTKALNKASELAEDIEVNYFMLGGVLQLINDNSWFEGFPDFDSFVFEKYGFQGRKARYLIAIYDSLVKKQIPWEKVSHLGWTKLKDLAPVLTLENVDEWVAKATPVTVAELQAMLKASATGTETPAKTKADLVTIKFPLKTDQAEIVQQALAKAKGELKTEFDTVALENICAGYLGGTTTAKVYDVDTIIQNTGFDTIMTRISELYPEYDIAVAPAKAPTVQ
jgi:hypothetical protein